MGRFQTKEDGRREQRHPGVGNVEIMAQDYIDQIRRLDLQAKDAEIDLKRETSA